MGDWNEVFALCEPGEQASPARPESRPRLTNRQAEVLTLIARGNTVRMTAGKLGIAEHTVSHYLAAIRELFGVHSSSHAAKEAMRLKLIFP